MLAAQERCGSGCSFGFREAVPAVLVPVSVPNKKGSSGSGFPFRFGSWAFLLKVVSKPALKGSFGSVQSS